MAERSVITITSDETEGKRYVTVSSEGEWPSLEDVLHLAQEQEMPFWIDEAAIAKGLEKRTFDKPFEIGCVKDGRVVITVGPGEEEAFMTIEPAYGGREMEIADVETALREKSVFFGIDKETINRAIADRDFGNRVCAASAKRAVNGTDARIECLFRTGWDVKPKAGDEVVKVDYRNVESVTSIHKDALLARKTVATPGENGVTVTGKTIRALPGKDVRLAPGKNTRLSEDGLELFAEIDGQPLRLDKISVEPIITVDGDVDYSTGNVDFVGSVKIYGSVISGFSVKASANVQIDGVVEDSHIEAGGDVLIRGGIRGRESLTVRAGGNVSALFIEQAFVEAGRNIIAQEVLHSELFAGDQVIVTSGKGLICGGRVIALNLVHAGIAGSHSEVRTELVVGFNPRQKAQLEALKEKKVKLKTTLEEMETGITTLERYKVENPALWLKHEQTYQKLVDTRQQLRDSLERTVWEIGTIEEKLVRAANAHIKIARIIHPNVLLRIGYLRFQNETELSATAFYEDEDEIKASAYIF